MLENVGKLFVGVFCPYINAASDKYGNESFHAFSSKHLEDDFASASDFY